MDTETRTVEDEARERVARGVALLDEKVPGWAARVDLDTLEMEDPIACVASQATGKSYVGAMGVLGVDAVGTDYVGGSQYGFHAWASSNDFRTVGNLDWSGYGERRIAEWAALDAEWRAHLHGLWP